MRFYAPGIQKGATWPKNFVVNQVIIRTAFSPDIPCSFETFKQDDTLSGRGAVVVSWEGEELKSFLTFSPEIRQVDNGTNTRASRKRSDGDLIFESVVPDREKGANCRHGFTGQFSIELYDRWPPLASDYEVREEWFGSIALTIHSDGVDPKCFLTFSSTPSTAGHKPHLPTHSNGVHELSLTGDTIIQENAGPAGTSVGKNLPLGSHMGSLKRESSHDDDQYKLRRSERLSRKARA